MSANPAAIVQHRYPAMLIAPYLKTLHECNDLAKAGIECLIKKIEVLQAMEAAHQRKASRARAHSELIPNLERDRAPRTYIPARPRPKTEYAKLVEQRGMNR